MSEHPDGQVFIDLHGFTEGVAPLSAEEVLDRALRSLGVPGQQIPQNMDERAALWRTRLADKRMLVVLDNVGDESQVRPLLPASPGCLVIVTSRRRLAGLDDTYPISLDVLSLDEAIVLFTRMAKTGQLRDGDHERIAELVELCGRLPLAIRIAAARLKHRPGWTVPHLAARLRDKQNQLTELEAGQRSLAAAVDVSYTRITSEEQRMYRLLGLHPGADIDPYAAAALTGTTVDEADRHLESLLDAHLIQQNLPGRYMFHDLLRTHAVQTCTARDPEPVQQSALTRLFSYYVRAATAATELAYPGKLDQMTYRHPEIPIPVFDDASAAAAWIDAELANLVATAIQAADYGQPALILQISEILTPHLGARARYSTAIRLHRRALEIAREIGNDIGEVSALYGLAFTEFQVGNQSAADHLQQALQVSRAVNYRPRRTSSPVRPRADLSQPGPLRRGDRVFRASSGHRYQARSARLHASHPVWTRRHSPCTRPLEAGDRQFRSGAEYRRQDRGPPGRDYGIAQPRHRPIVFTVATLLPLTTTGVH